MKDNTLLRKPEWLKIKLQQGGEYKLVSEIMKEHGLHTICSSGKCPNMNECWSKGTATFMILGNICTRACKFCATQTGKPLAADPNEPVKVARSIALMKLRYTVITSVDRDDLPDGGAAIWAETVRAIRAQNPETAIELLIPDFDGRTELVETVVAAQPDVIGHNIETVQRLTPQVRSRARYDTSMRVLRYLSSRGVLTKSGLMVGIGETDEEVKETIGDLADAGCRLLTIGQYLQPTKKHLNVERYVHPDTFAQYKEWALEKGFTHVESAPMVRSSYMAERAVNGMKQKKNLTDL